MATRGESGEVDKASLFFRGNNKRREPMNRKRLRGL